MSNSISTNNAPKPVGSYPHARRVGDFLFLSGVGPRIAGSGGGDSKVPGLELTADGDVVKYDLAQQVHAVFGNVKSILEASGSSWEELVDVTVFLTNMSRDFSEFNRIYAEYFSDLGDKRPCRTTVEINCLPTPIAIELKCIAIIKS
jgi:2-aminomuconate deaminase